MNREETENAIKVMQAFLDGKPLEVRSFGETKWIEFTYTSPSWNWKDSEYRIAPEPMEIEVWVNTNGSLVAPHGFHKLCTGAVLKKFREVL